MPGGGGGARAGEVEVPVGVKCAILEVEFETLHIFTQTECFLTKGFIWN